MLHNLKKDLSFCEKVSFVHFNMAAYTLPEGFTEFDMFTFGTGLLVAGKWTDHTGRHVSLSARIKGTVHYETICFDYKSKNTPTIILIVMFEVQPFFHLQP